ncbi:MAG: hypothetical protein ACRDGI_06830 [Candidatus Limnocylindrales bacterium]
MRFARTYLSAVVIVLSTAALAACASSPTSVPAASIGSPLPNGATAQAPAGSSSAGAPASAGGASGVVDVCQVLGVAEVQPLFVTTITATDDPSGTGDQSICQYQVDPHDGLAPMEIEAVFGSQASVFVESRHGGNEGPYVDIPNAGDQAFRPAGQASLVALKGMTACSIQLGGGNSAHYAGLASPDPLGNLPDDSASAFVARLVPLCLKIFAAAGQ